MTPGRALLPPLFALVFLGLSAPAQADAPAPYQDPTQSVDTRVADLLTRMTPEEKLSLTAGQDAFSTRAIPRLGIPSLKMTDGPNGVRWGQTTAFPTGVCLAATWDTALARRYGEALGQEALGQRRRMLLGPCVNINRHPLGGRSFESLGEDPYLAGSLAVPYIQGVQSQGVAACVKHLAANNEEVDRMTVNAEVDERALREIYLPAFEASVTEGKALSVMAAYNRLNGPYCTANPWLQNQVLKQEWGFQGLVVSDWGATHEGAGALLAGLDVEMPGPGDFLGDKLRHELGDPNVRAAADQAAGRVLRVLFRLGLFDRKPDQVYPGPTMHRDLARQMAEEGAVLLKNDGGLLPLPPSLAKLAVIGPNAAVARTGGGGSSKIEAVDPVSPLDGLRQRLGAKVQITYAQGCIDADLQPVPAALLAEAVSAAAQADVALVFAGLSDHYEGEGFDRADFGLPAGQAALIQAVAKANPRTVVILNSGSPVDLEPWLASVPALLQAWYPGVEAGDALARVLCGDVNPGGKLPVSFPVKLEDSPAYGHFPGQDGAVRYAEGLLVGYRYYDSRQVAPQFPFGHGLSYTQFGYSNLKLRSGKARGLNLIFTLKNTGLRPGAEVAQVYVRPISPKVERPFQELKSFQRVELAAGASQSVELKLPVRAFSYWDVKGQAWKADPGAYEIRVGSSSRDIRLTKSWNLRP